MSFSFGSMIRLLALGSVGLTMLAVGVSRLAPPETVRRTDAPETMVNISDHLLGVPDRNPRWLDAEGGTVAITPLPGDDVLEAASCSPWVDAQGRRQVVGRWSNRTLEGPQTIAHEFGIARLSFPDGQILDQIPLDNVPCSPPCWLPGDRARILYTAGDGHLRRFDFESAADDGSNFAKPADARPIVIGWDCQPPGCDEVYFMEVSIPHLADNRLRGLVLATLRYKTPAPRLGSILSRSEVWWLRLDSNATRITAAGRLLEGSPAAVDVPEGDIHLLGDERRPTLTTLPDGTLALAFARAQQRAAHWAIGLGALEFQPNGDPVCHAASVRIVNTREYPGPFAFSPDGRWLNLLVIEPHASARVVRYSTAPGHLAPTPTLASNP